jgi:hypothetical protein
MKCLLSQVRHFDGENTLRIKALAAMKEKAHKECSSMDVKKFTLLKETTSPLP